MAATAVEAWDERWATPEGRDDWLLPHPAVAALVPVLKARGMQHVLDLGCGVGRHALLFAEHGFVVEAIDGAAALVGRDRQFRRQMAGRHPVDAGGSELQEPRVTDQRDFIRVQFP